jgi:hypothetical protein
MPIVASDWAVLNPASQASPATLVSAATIAPSSFLTVLTGNTAVVTITPPVQHAHMLAVQFAGTAGVTAAGNIFAAKASVVGEVILFVFNPNTQKYLPVG